MGCPNQQSGDNAFLEHKTSSIRPSRGGLACMVNSEIGAVLAVMRRNVRWGVRYMEDDDHAEHSLIQSFKELRKQIFSWENRWHNVSPVLYLQPFLDVIKSEETSAPITGVALSAVYKILTLDILDIDYVNVDDALHLIVDAVTSCRFEVTDPASEEVVLVKILQVLLACMKNKSSVKLSNQYVCNIVNTCFRVVHQATSKGELLQRIAHHTMHELIRCIFSHLLDIDSGEHAPPQRGSLCITDEVGAPDVDDTYQNKQLTNGNVNLESNSQPPLVGSASDILLGTSAGKMDEGATVVGDRREAAQNEGHVSMEPYGIPCMVEIFHFLCSLLNGVEHTEISRNSNPVAYDEDVPLFALGLINSAIELGGSSIGQHPKLLALVQDELFHNLMQFGLSMSPLILSIVCSIVFNLYHHLHTKLKLQFEAFFSCVLVRVAQNKHGASYQLQEVAMETLVDLCRQRAFMAEMYANFDCDISSSNVFEEIANVLSKSAFPVNGPLSAMHVLALDGLIAMIQGMADRIGNDSPAPEQASLDLEEYKPFWTVKCENYDNPNNWVTFLREMKYRKRRLIIGVDHFNRDPKKGLELLQGMHLFPDKLDPKSVAYFFRYTTGLDKNLVGDFLGNHDEFCIQVLHEFSGTFDFRDINLDTALRVFLETFRLPGESQKIQRVLEAFAERYHEQSPSILVDTDAALLLSYSLILLNTDQHNAQVKKKMSEEDFIRNNRRINGGNDLPREYLSELYHSICQNEIRMNPEQSAGLPVMTPSNWIALTHKSKQAAPFVICDSGAHLDYDMFAILSGPAIASLSVVFDQVEQEDVLQTCIEGFLAIAKISACYHLDDVLDDLIVSLCKFTNLLHPLSVEELILAFGEDTRARIAIVAVFIIANKYGDFIRSGWKSILDCILSLYKLGFLPLRLASDAADDLKPSSESEQGKPPTSSAPASRMPSAAPSRKSSGLIGRFSQLLYLDAEDSVSEPSEEQLAAHQHTLQMIQSCHIDSIFTESKFLQGESLLQLSRAIVLAAGRYRKGSNSLEDEEIAVFCMELLTAITLNNRDRFMLLWQGVYEHIANVVQTTVMPCALAEKAVFGLLRICQRLLPYKENLSDELLTSLQLILKLDARVADVYCERITREVMHLVKANAMQIRSHMGWRTIISLLSITARHPEASESGFETVSFIMADGAYLLPANYVLCVNAARQFAESRVGHVERSVESLDLMAGSVICLAKWSCKTKEAAGEEAMKLYQDIGEMWLRLVLGLRKVCLDQREEVRNHAILSLQRCLTGVDGLLLPSESWLQCFDLVIFTLLDDLLEIAQENSPKDYRNMEGSLALSMKLSSKAFLQFLLDLSQSTSFCKLWVGVLNRMERYMNVRFRGKWSEKIHELVPELLKNTLLVMKTKGILVPHDAITEDRFWLLTWLHVKNIAPFLQEEVFPGNELEQLQAKHIKTGGISVSNGNSYIQAGETTA
ncbi:ARF guanine-nucleotide exchange factor GNOM-like [Actinidia eriantha]|uniref:ARF guanine-nucleotide exchange factor GNOM-like n=1 Tax=Actinidia eriantha TaxID=165200 RepID=UPI00258D7392|nr:ARF guanine-nucleotide exchange factor GNOM-like [Actinidia eriantha]XP_057463263.1 ARF guanine-nucleotide exchange factor GNOM-like [Actinidia eriantha]XP_057463266.1 ARF guanine-nucleotide exchange factor GNOM-like [Actinidia eriantha]